MLQNDLNLLRHLAWSFHRTTGLDYDELFSEASLKYCECVGEHNPELSKRTTFIYGAVKKHLIWWTGYQYRRTPVDVDLDYIPALGPPDYEFFSNLDHDVKEAFSVLLSMFETEDFTGSKGAKGRLTYELRQRGWAWGRIEKTFRKAKNYVNQTEVGGIII